MGNLGIQQFRPGGSAGWQQAACPRSGWQGMSASEVIPLAGQERASQGNAVGGSSYWVQSLRGVAAV